MSAAKWVLEILHETVLGVNKFSTEKTPRYMHSAMAAYLRQQRTESRRDRWDRANHRSVADSLVAAGKRAGYWLAFTHFYNQLDLASHDMLLSLLKSLFSGLYDFLNAKWRQRYLPLFGGVPRDGLPRFGRPDFGRYGPTYCAPSDRPFR